jgi:hypothetical protein
MPKMGKDMADKTVNCEVLFVGLMNPISIPLSTAVSLKIPQG